MENNNQVCVLCGSLENLTTLEVPNQKQSDSKPSILACNTCKTQYLQPELMDPNHWRCLNDSMWSTEPAVQVVVWRLLNRLKNEGWPQDLLDMLYLEESTLHWAQETEMEEERVVHKDSNGHLLASGDSIVLVKDLNVKGANFTAKRGAAVRNISLVHDNPEQIEGKLNGQHIVLLTKYVKKTN